MLKKTTGNDFDAFDFKTDMSSPFKAELLYSEQFVVSLQKVLDDARGTSNEHQRAWRISKPEFRLYVLSTAQTIRWTIKKITLEMGFCK